MSAPEAPRPRPGPDRGALVIALLLAVLAAVIFWQTRAMPVAAMYARVGPTQAPYVIATGLALLAIGTAVSAVRRGFPEREQDELPPILWIVAGLAGQMLLLNLAGFAIATGVLFACAARAFGRGPLWKTLPIGIVFSFLVWLVFARVLQLSLPAGPLERLLF
jgi:putative tricarboxylic transport membrane protein